jgi:prolipoprotein diacylglyceryltransferase
LGGRLGGSGLRRRLLGDRLGGAAFAGAFLATVLVAVACAGAAFFAGAALVAVAAGFGVVSLGNFFAPETTALSSAPARNFGTTVFLARLVSPVRGLRTIRAPRSIASNAPNPVMATLPPFLVSSRWTVSITDSRACWADRRFPSKCTASASTNWLLFTASLRERKCRAPRSISLERYGLRGPCTNTNAAIRPCFRGKKPFDAPKRLYFPGSGDLG